jgi:polysaccharide biosynthesis transport protein
MMNMIVSRQPSHAIEPIDQPPPPSEELGSISVQWIVAFLLRRWMLIAGTGLLVAVLCFTTFLFQPSKFTAVALMMINPGGDRVLQQDQMVTAATDERGGEAAVIESQLEVLRSPMLIGRLVDSLKLTQDAEWNPALRRNRSSALAYASAAVSDRNSAGGAPGAATTSVRQEVINTVAKNIVVRRRATSYAVEVNATSQNPRRAAEMANGLVNLFMEYQFESRFQTAERANKWLEERLQGLKADLQAKEGEAERYRAAHGLFITQGSLLNEQQTSELQASMMQARADLAEKEARLRQVRQTIDSGGSADTIVGILNSEAITDLRAREADILRRQADLESRYGDLHPAVQNVRAEKDDIERQIQAAIARVTASLENEVAISRARLNDLQSSMAGMRGELAGDNESLVHLRELERERDAANAVYQAFLQRFHEITGQGEMRSTTVELVSAATVPMARSSPNLKFALLISLALGFALGIAAGFLADALGEGFRTPEEIERDTGMSTLASVPRLRKRELMQLAPNAQHPAGYLIERQMSEFTESLRVLRTTIQYSGVGQPRNQIVAITSALPNEGKTTVSLCLARVAALSQQRVLLIDCDLRRRSLKEVLELEPQAGLVEVLSGAVHWRQAVLVDEASGMHLLPLSDTGFTPKDVFGGDDMSTLLDELRGSFDLIVLDCAPVLAVAETRVVVAKADCTVLVARWEKTPVRAVRTALRQLQEAGAHLRGVTLNYIGQRAGGRAYKMEGYYSA